MTPLEVVLNAIENVNVLDKSINYNQYIPLDLSLSNNSFLSENLKTASDFEKYLNKLLLKSKSQVAFGGYNEQRNLYKRSTVFNDTDNEERNIHIGLDLWINAGTSVLAALDGTIHSFNFNTELGNYGPTIILKHTINSIDFYTLYGHLSLHSIENISIGDFYTKGQELATLGDSSVNGDYAPHLHFQIINDIEHFKGDYPGVCSISNLDFYLNNCPDPNLLLKII